MRLGGSERIAAEVVLLYLTCFVVSLFCSLIVIPKCCGVFSAVNEDFNDVEIANDVNTFNSVKLTGRYLTTGVKERESIAADPDMRI